MTRPPPRPPLSPPPPLLRPPPTRPASFLQHPPQPLRQFRRRPVGSRHEFLDTLPDIGVISSFDRWAAEVLNFAAPQQTTRWVTNGLMHRGNGATTRSTCRRGEHGW